MSSSRRRRDGDESFGKSQNEERLSRHTKETGDRLQREHFLKPDSDQIDLDLLLDAVLDINDKLKIQDASGGKTDGDCDSVCTSRTETQKRSNPSSQSERQNFSFRNEQIFNIDRENQRLLKEITRRRPRSAITTRDRKYHKTTSLNEPVRIKTSSEVNRQRLQKKIDEENQALLRRIQSVKATESLNRDHLLRDHTVNEKSRKRPSSASRPSSSGRMSIRSKTLSGYNFSIFDDGASQKSSSASSRKSSGRKSFPKPAWEAGW